MNILVCPDSFKGSISARDFCDVAKRVLRQRSASFKVATRPLADGGENTLECIFPYIKDAEIVWVETVDPLMRTIKAPYILAGDQAYIEMAKSSGLTLVDDDERDVVHSTSYGTGLLIKDAMENGAKTINLFVGGTATNDGGVGLANALGIDFYNEDGVIHNPRPVDILEIVDIECNSHMEGIVFNFITDVQNVLCGENGASRVYGPQKNADDDEVDFLDKSLQYLSDLIYRNTGNHVQNIRGIGAGGGVGTSIAGFYNVNFKKGTEFIFELIGLPQKIKQADLVITGEGRFDAQTLNGKLVDGVLGLCHKYQKPSIVICGQAKLIKIPYDAKIIPLMKDGLTEKECIEQTQDLLKTVLENIDLR